ncbi:hypothetical protein EPN83_00195 [Patescibacteria group bacterium]|nr:MAG: hypothetical protein EPN83_00195 [Patescibacteria group bacterium]
MERIPETSPESFEGDGKNEKTPAEGKRDRDSGQTVGRKLTKLGRKIALAATLAGAVPGQAKAETPRDIDSNKPTAAAVVEEGKEKTTAQADTLRVGGTIEAGGRIRTARPLRGIGGDVRAGGDVRGTRRNPVGGDVRRTGGWVPFAGGDVPAGGVVYGAGGTVEAGGNIQTLADTTTLKEKTDSLHNIIKSMNKSEREAWPPPQGMEGLLASKEIVLMTTERGMRRAIEIILRLQSVGVKVSYKVVPSRPNMSRAANARYHNRDLQTMQAIESIINDVVPIKSDSTSEPIDLEIFID